MSQPARVTSKKRRASGRVDTLIFIAGRTTSLLNAEAVRR